MKFDTLRLLKVVHFKLSVMFVAKKTHLFAHLYKVDYENETRILSYTSRLYYRMVLH